MKNSRKRHDHNSVSVTDFRTQLQMENEWKAFSFTKLRSCEKHLSFIFDIHIFCPPFPFAPIHPYIHLLLCKPH